MDFFNYLSNIFHTFGDFSFGWLLFNDSCVKMSQEIDVLEFKTKIMFGASKPF